MDINKAELLSKLKVNPDFNVPHYIFDEIVEYIELTAKGKCKSAKWSNIKSLIRLAVVNERLTEAQADYLIETYSREKINGTD